jgi:uncharacterized protein
MKQRSFLLALAVLGALALTPALAQAHVTVQPKEAPADSYTQVNVRVPNEDEKASTKSVKVQFPAGIYYTGYQAIPGWKITVKTRKLATPVKMEDDNLTTETDEVDFTATGGGIEPGQFQDFPLVISTPSKVGEVLKFPAVQTYSSGEVVRWIGAESSDNPAPTVTLTAAESEHGGGTASNASGDGSSSDTLAWIALAVGGLGLILGAVALATRRRG